MFEVDERVAAGSRWVEQGTKARLAAVPRHTCGLVGESREALLSSSVFPCLQSIFSPLRRGLSPKHLELGLHFSTVRLALGFGGFSWLTCALVSKDSNRVNVTCAFARDAVFFLLSRQSALDLLHWLADEAAEGRGENVLDVEVLWTPADPDDSLDRDDLDTKWPELRAL